MIATAATAPNGRPVIRLEEIEEMNAVRKKYYACRCALAITSLVLLLYGGLFTAYVMYRHFGPRNLMRIDQPLIAIPLIVLAGLGGIASLLFGAFSGAIVWLIVMKPLLNRDELRNMLGLDRGRPSRSNRVMKWIVDLV